MATMPHKIDDADSKPTEGIITTTAATTTATTTKTTTNDTTSPTNDIPTTPTPTTPTPTPTPTTTTPAKPSTAPSPPSSTRPTPTTTTTTTTPQNRHTTNANTSSSSTAPPKRTTIPLADGWTLVSTTKSHHHRQLKNRRRQNRKNKDGDDDDMQQTTTTSTTTGGNGGGGGGGGTGRGGYYSSPAERLRAAHEPAGPAKRMPGVGKERLLERLGKFRERWGECGCRRGIGGVLGRAGVVVGAGGGGEGEDGEKREEREGEREDGEDGGGGARRKPVGIRNAVCIGLGSLSVDNVAAGVRSMWQLVCFLDIVGMLNAGGGGGASGGGGDGDGGVKMYAEDPVFNDLDVEVFEELGITVVQGLRSTDGSRQEGAAQFIEPDSFVFAPFMPSFMVLEDFLADRDPAIYVGNDVQATLELARSQVRYSGDVDERTRRCIRVAEEFLAQGREVVTLPEFDLHEHALAGQMIYWRKPAEES
ncbi:uncharacterized protein BKCO1_19000139 [Diplodia corticola]|uniref:SRR1-like domain-containing protein n=1 Tax=Diplodia corticola TaxID=236234 RepID=A0A1J9S5Q7_9PEZI|nr:uncharacterized protein BKCO1_19000139 [Diplodia corticola]OJD34949.1 hypothetical protein BKCO1_19000139 [Diplodia corticola]